MNEIITVSTDTRASLSKLVAQDESFDDVIVNLLVHYNENEEFTDAQAEFYNSEIEKSENGFYDDTPNISLAELKERVTNFEK